MSQHFQQGDRTSIYVFSLSAGLVHRICGKVFAASSVIFYPRHTVCTILGCDHMDYLGIETFNVCTCDECNTQYPFLTGGACINNLAVFFSGVWGARRETACLYVLGLILKTARRPVFIVHLRDETPNWTVR